MTIVVPCLDSKGLDSRICGHFGRSPWFAFVDLPSRELRVVPNGNKAHAHGQCGPIDEIVESSATDLLCQGIGAGAISILRERGLNVLRTSAETLGEALDRYEAGACEPLGGEGTCGCHGDCHD